MPRNGAGCRSHRKLGRRTFEIGGAFLLGNTDTNYSADDEDSDTACDTAKDNGMFDFDPELLSGLPSLAFEGELLPSPTIESRPTLGGRSTLVELQSLRFRRSNICQYLGYR